MSPRLLVALLVVGVLLATGTHSPAQEKLQQRTFARCFLYRGPDGAVWVGHPLVSLGMIGVAAYAPHYRLSSAFAEELAPVVNDLENLPEKPEFWWWGLPSPKDPDKPMVLICLETEAELRKAARVQGPEPGRIADANSPAIYEITSANLVYAEFISAQWRRAWKALDAGLGRVVAVSHTAPGGDKAKRLAEAIESSSRALGAMTRAESSQRWQALVQGIQPRARSVRLFQRHVGGSGLGEWGGLLRQCVDTLRIEPRTPLPKPATPCPMAKLLAESPTAEALIETLRQSWPEDTLGERLIFSRELNRMVFVWQVKDLTPAQFDNLREQAKEDLARQQEAATESSSASESEDVSVAQWNVVLRPASADVLAEKGLLSATLVAEVSGDGSPVGLQKGDLIIDYHNVYDLVMSGHPEFRPARRLARMARYGGQLNVVRGDRLIAIEAERPQ
ncbi:MAG: hypothetical protein JXB62_07415 [Pirellulales bacterium]|nr:hypothetical protein [Pirellulales bacterium]